MLIHWVFSIPLDISEFCYFQIKCDNCPSQIHLTCTDLSVSLQEAAQVFNIVKRKTGRRKTCLLSSLIFYTFTFCYFQIKCNNCPSWIHLTCNDLQVSLQEAQVSFKCNFCKSFEEPAKESKQPYIGKRRMGRQKLVCCHSSPLIQYTFTFCYFQIKCDNCPSLHLKYTDRSVSLQEAAQSLSSATSASPLKNQQRNQNSPILAKE